MLSIFSTFLVAMAITAPNDQLVVEVFLPTILGATEERVFLQARKVVSQIYSEIGLRIVWRPITAAPGGCDQTAMRRRIVVTLRTGAPTESSKDALAYSLPHATNGPCIMILENRIHPFVRTNPISIGFLLGHVLAHEMGHVLQGVVRHSETGIMKANWSAGEIANMTKARLQFTPHDKRLILEGARTHLAGDYIP